MRQVIKLEANEARINCRTGQQLLLDMVMTSN